MIITFRVGKIGLIDYFRSDIEVNSVTDTIYVVSPLLLIFKKFIVSYLIIMCMRACQSVHPSYF